jgi:hypothetical protein
MLEVSAGALSEAVSVADTLARVCCDFDGGER